MNKETFTKLGLYSLVILTLVLAAVGALSLVGMRQLISESARVCKTLETELQQFERKNSFLESKIAQAHNPDYMKKHIPKDLAPPTQTQVVWANLDAHKHSFEPQNIQPYVIAFNLAFLDGKKKENDRIQ